MWDYVASANELDNPRWWQRRRSYGSGANVTWRKFFIIIGNQQRRQNFKRSHMQRQKIQRRQRIQKLFLCNWHNLQILKRLHQAFWGGMGFPGSVQSTSPCFAQKLQKLPSSTSLDPSTCTCVYMSNPFANTLIYKYASLLLQFWSPNPPWWELVAKFQGRSFCVKTEITHFTFVTDPVNPWSWTRMEDFSKLIAPTLVSRPIFTSWDWLINQSLRN